MPTVDPLLGVHSAIFETYFPATLLVPESIRAIITQKAARVSAGLYSQIQSSSTLQQLLAPLVAPTQFLTLPLQNYLRNLHQPAVDEFLEPGKGFGGIKPEHRVPVFSAFFASTDAISESPLAFIAMKIRMFYLSVIWDLELAVPIAGILRPTVFIDDAEAYARRHAPQINSRLVYDAQLKSITHRDGPIDYLIIGSGPGGSTVAHQLSTRTGPDGRRARVVLLERGSFVVWGSMDTRSHAPLMFKANSASTTNNSVVLRSGQVVGGGTAVNVDLAFSPLEGTSFSRIQEWARDNLIDGRYFTAKRLAAAYQWVREQIQTRQLTQSELNRDNLALWNGALGLGVEPSLYNLNRFPVNTSPSPVSDKLDAGRQLLLEAITAANNPLGIIPDAKVQAITFDRTSDLKATGVTFVTQTPWTEHKNTVVDPNGFNIPVGTTVSIQADNVVLAGGTLGTTELLLKTAKVTPEIANPNIGLGPILHPSMPVIGIFDHDINLLQGLDCASFLDSFGIDPGFIFETITGMPSYGAVMTPGDAAQIYEVMLRFNQCAGFGVMLVDTPSLTNRLRLDENDEIMVDYNLSDADKARFRIGVSLAVRMMFLAKAQRVIIPSNENYSQTAAFDPMFAPSLDRIEEADAIADNLQFTPNRSLLTSAHLQAANKMGDSPAKSVVSWRHRVWNVSSGAEIPNLYVMDGSIFPTSVGANPMQSIYTFAKIFSDRLIEGIDNDTRRKAALHPASQSYSEARPPVAFPT